MADFLKISKLIENLTGFIKVKIELLKLDILEEISKGIASLFSLVLVLILGLFVIAFGSLALAVFLNSHYGSPYLGYLVITGLYVIILIVVLLLARTGKLTDFIEEQLVNKSREIIEESQTDE